MGYAKQGSGYIGTEQQWKIFLDCWEMESLARVRRDGPNTPLERKMLDEGRLSMTAATRNDINQAEARLGVVLPESLKDFWLVSGGLIVLGMDAEDGLVYGPKEVGWVSEFEPELLDGPEQSIAIADDDYFNYSTSQDPALFRGEYVSETLVISQIVDSGVYLLNPKVVAADGEWEAWFMSWELPGAFRFRSFAHLMRYAYLKGSENTKVDWHFDQSEYRKTCAESVLVNPE